MSENTNYPTLELIIHGFAREYIEMRLIAVELAWNARCRAAICRVAWNALLFAKLITLGYSI